jgi:hypothetical protein
MKVLVHTRSSMHSFCVSRHPDGVHAAGRSPGTCMQRAAGCGGTLPWRALSVANRFVKPALFSAACKHSTRLEGTAARVRRGTERRGQRAETGEHNAGVGGWGEVGKASHNLARLGGGDVSRSREQSADRERGEVGRRFRGQTKSSWG